ncbi:MAG TPA: Xaa-Pro aminopeptidase, partial [Myxococcus sp.]|nr:Xaa-Pro aminopeptidase [Myxococcus sp.]
MRTRTLLLAPLLFSTACATAHTPPQATAAATAAAKAPEPQRPFGTLREQAERQQAWLRERMDKALPQLMRQYGIQTWVVPMREYNEDPIFKAVVAPTTFAARRRTIYVFHDLGPEKGVERLALGGGSQGGVF